MIQRDGLVIEPARPSDAAPLFELENAAFTGDRLSRRSLRRHMTSSSALVLVGRVEGEIAGYALVLTRKGSKIARLYSLAVAAKFAGKGHGRRLAEAAERSALESGLQAMSLEVRKDNSRALTMYRQMGYGNERPLPGYYSDGGEGIRLSKRLSRRLNAETSRAMGDAGTQEI